MQIQAISHFSQETKQTAQKSRTINRTTVDDVTKHAWGLVVSVATIWADMTERASKLVKAILAR